MSDPLETRLLRHRVRPAPEALTESLVAAIRREAARSGHPPGVAVAPEAEVPFGSLWRTLGALWAGGLALLLLARLPDGSPGAAPGPAHLSPDQLARIRAERVELRRLAGLEPVPVSTAESRPPRPSATQAPSPGVRPQSSDFRPTRPALG